MLKSINILSTCQHCRYPLYHYHLRALTPEVQNIVEIFFPKNENKTANKCNLIKTDTLQNASNILKHILILTNKKRKVAL